MSPTSTVQEYLKFPLVKPPIQQEQAKRDLLPFVSSVVCALKELHDFGIALLDIRLETVCCDSNNRAVLINLDRFEPVKLQGLCRRWADATVDVTKPQVRACYLRPSLSYPILPVRLPSYPVLLIKTPSYTTPYLDKEKELVADKVG